MQTTVSPSFRHNGANVQLLVMSSLTSEKFTATISCHGISAETILMEISLIKDAVHKLIHASNTETIHKYMDLLQLDSKRLAKVNNLRQLASMQPI